MNANQVFLIMCIYRKKTEKMSFIYTNDNSNDTTNNYNNMSNDLYDT